MTNQVNDEQLIQWYQKGNAEAFEQLYARYKNAIYHYFYRQVQSESLAEELHQDVWMNIIKSSSRFNQQSSFKTWLYKIAHNRLVDHYRQADRQPLHLVKENLPDSETLSETKAETEESLSDDQQASKPDEVMQQQQISNAVLDGIALLPGKQKEVFLLHEKSGLTLEEIARVTDSSFESTKSRLRYAVKKLRQHLAQYLGVQL